MTLRRMEDVKPAPPTMVVDLDSDDESEHVTPAPKNNLFAKPSNESSLFSESSEYQSEDDIAMQDGASDEVLSDASDHVINGAPVEELSSDEDEVSKHDVSEPDHDEELFSVDQAWVDSYRSQQVTSDVHDYAPHGSVDPNLDVPPSELDDLPPVTSALDFVEQLETMQPEDVTSEVRVSVAVTEEHVPESEHAHMSVDHGEELSANQSRVSHEVSSPHQSHEDKSAVHAEEESAADEASSVNQSLVSRDDRSDSVNQSVNQSLLSHDEHSDEETRARESLGGTIRRSSRLQQTPKPQYNIQKLSKRTNKKEDETAPSETPAKLRRAAARVHDPLTKAKTKRMPKRK